jgi:hypothetical protein
MTATLPSVPLAPRRREFIAEANEGQSLLYAAGLFLLLVMIPALAAMSLETRTLNGINVWIKPLKFEFSVAVHFVTVALFVTVLPPKQRARKLIARLCQAMATVGLLEILYICLQASKGEASHFNLSTPWTFLFYSSMGLGAAIMLTISGWVGVLVLRYGATEKPLVFAIGLSLVAGSLLGGLAGAFISVHNSHWVGGGATDAGGLPVFGWSRTGGDLRVAHFFGMHIMQAVPIATWLLSCILPARWQKPAVISILTFAALVALGVFAQAVAGHPLVPAST